jgi:hypothetical protein
MGVCIMKLRAMLAGGILEHHALKPDFEDIR